MRRLLRILSVALVTAGLVVLTDAALTLAWKEPVSAFYGRLQQNEAREQLRDLEAEFLDDSGLERIDSIADPARRADRLATRFKKQLTTGEGIGRIVIPAADIDYVVVEGTDTETLKKGPGRYPETFLPGQGNTIGIAGHRTTYGAPFRNIDEIADGDEIKVDMPYGSFTYEVEKSRIVEPTDVEIVRPVGRERLVITACHPPYSAAERYAVFARLTAVDLPS
jgi:sortase A